MPPPEFLRAETKAEAATWLARLHADDRSAADEQAFQAWLAARPENARAFEAVTTLWDLASGLRMEQFAPSQDKVLLRRRSVLASIGSLVAASAGLAFWEEAYAGVYETAIGEQKHVTLSDGTQVFLDTNTRIRERFTRSLRRLELDRGRVNVRVRSDPLRPFVVEAAGQRILAERTAFDLRRDGDRISVVLLQGHATVLANARGANRPVVLQRGQRAIAIAYAPVQLDRPNLVPLTAWQSGQAIFEGETLSAAVAEMNRYSTVRLDVNDKAIANLRLSGVYRVGDNEAFAHSVSLLLPVTIERYSDHIAFVRDESRMPEG
jgi:transmembrane sensor